MYENILQLMRLLGIFIRYFFLRKMSEHKINVTKDVLKDLRTFECTNACKQKRFLVTKGHLQISLVVLSKLINFYFLWNHQKTAGFLMILGGIEVN